MHELSLHPVIRQWLQSQGIPEDYFLAHLAPESQLVHKTFSQEAVEKARARIREAAAKKDPILVFGDYDVDGTCGTAIMVRALLNLGTTVRYFIPDRLRDGYGLNPSLISKIKSRGFKLLITIDCGSRNVAEIEAAQKDGLDVIVLDHHSTGEQIPEAFAVIHPAVTFFPYHFRFLCGTALSFLLAQPFLKEEHMTAFAPLLSLATVTDMVPLLGENRALIKQALRFLTQSSLPGLQALFHIARCREDTDPQFLMGYILGPRINAAGRLGEASRAVELFLAEKQEKAWRLALALDEENKKRRKIQEEVCEAAENLARCREDQPLLFLHHPDWHLGVLGIVAAKLAKDFNKPALLATHAGNGLYKGSGRSIPHLPLLPLLEKRQHLFENYGGHEQAVGFALKEKQLERAEEELCAEARQNFQKKKGEERIKVLLSSLDDVFFDQYNLLPPFGPRYERPLFVSEETVLLEKGAIRDSHGNLFYYTLDQKQELKKGKIVFSIDEKKNRHLLIKEILPS